MADFRKPKYSGSLNLAPECGPVLIELDTDAKTATASLEDPASQYTLAGGGGTEAATVSVTVGSGLLYAVAVLPHVEGMPEDYPVGLQSLTYSHATPDFGALTVPLYEGKCIWLSNLLEMSPAPTVTVTGDITYNETYGTFTIEGDGSITLE